MAAETTTANSPANHHNQSRRSSPDDFTLLRKKPQTVTYICIYTYKYIYNFRLSPSNKTFKNYRKPNWEKLTDEIEHSLHEATTPNNVPSANNTHTNLILLADKRHIPKGRLKKLDQPLPQHIKD